MLRSVLFCWEIKVGSAKRIRDKSGVVAASSSTTMASGLRPMKRLGAACVTKWGSVPGVFLLVWQMCVLGFVCRTHGGC